MTVFDIAAAELQREELEERLHRLRADLEVTQAAIDRAQADYHRLEGRISLLREQGAEEPAKRHRKRTVAAVDGKRVGNPKRAKIADDALALIAEVGRPIGRTELFEQLVARGMRLEGKNPLMVFSTMLWRERERIVRLRGFGYWPADKRFPPAKYDPVE